MKIAIVDDEKNVRLAIKTALKKENYEIIEFSNGQEAFDSPEIPDLYILDIMMPVMDGITFLRKIREKGIEVPVMFLTSKDEEFDKVLGLELGADDYLCKPFSIRELIARIHVLLRRRAAFSVKDTNADSILCGGPVSLNETTFNVTVAGVPVVLTVTEFRILQAFLLHKNEVLSREQLIQISYPEETYLNDRAIDCHITRLRKKLSINQLCQNCIETIYGIGYKCTLI